MPSAETREQRSAGAGTPPPSPPSPQGWLDPRRSRWTLPTVTAAAWAALCFAIATAVRLGGVGETQPSWGEIAAVTAGNFAVMFVAVFVVAALVRLALERRDRHGRSDGVLFSPEARSGGIWDRELRGRPVMPSTTEGLWAVLAALVAWLPFVGGPAMLAAPVLLVLAWRRGDRAWLLVLPVLIGVFFVVFVVAEFTVGHD